MRFDGQGDDGGWRIRVVLAYVHAGLFEDRISGLRMPGAGVLYATRYPLGPGTMKLGRLLAG